MRKKLLLVFLGVVSLFGAQEGGQRKHNLPTRAPRDSQVSPISPQIPQQIISGVEFVLNPEGTTAISGSGSGGVTAVGPIGSSPNANAATITGSTLNLEPASASFPGVVTTGTQTFTGNVTFNDVVVSESLALTGIQYETPTGGGSITIADTTGILITEPASNVSVQTITLPSTNLINGQMLWLCTTRKITSLTWVGGTIAAGVPGNLNAGYGVGLIYYSTLGKWYIWNQE